MISDLRRHSFSSNACFAEVLVSKAEEYVHGLVVIHCQDWSENICGRFALVIAAIQSYINYFNERLKDFVQNNNESYRCPMEQGGKMFSTNQKVCLRFRSKPIRLHKFIIARENPSNFTQI